MANEPIITVVEPLVVARFWSKVEVGRPGVCWPWRAARHDRGGYGLLRVDGRLVRAHRFAYELVNGPLPPEAVARHRCNNPPCCNPAHLMDGTQLDNVDDMVRAGRQRNGTTRLTPSDVEGVRTALAGGARQKDIAQRYGITQSQVSHIKTGKRWTA